jgi:hypothetical protein
MFFVSPNKLFFHLITNSPFQFYPVTASNEQHAAVSFQTSLFQMWEDDEVLVEKGPLPETSMDLQSGRPHRVGAGEERSLPAVCHGI